MVPALVALFDSGRVYLTKRSPEAEALKNEPANLKHINEKGCGQYGAIKMGSYDDLVVA